MPESTKSVEFEAFSEEDPEAYLDTLVQVTDDAFCGKGPSEEDARDHLEGDYTVVVAIVDGEAVGYSTAVYDDSFLLHHGTAVSPGHQEKGLGQMLQHLAALAEVYHRQDSIPEERFWMGGRVQSFFYYDYLKDLGEVYPSEDSKPTEDVLDAMEEVAVRYQGEDQFSRRDLPVIRESYDPPFIFKPGKRQEFEERWDKLIGRSLEDPLKLKFEQGDAITVVARTSPEEVIAELEQNFPKSDFNFFKFGETRSIDEYWENLSGNLG